MKRVITLFILLFSFIGCNDIENINIIIPEPIDPINTIDTEPSWSYNGRFIAYVHYVQDSIERRNSGVQIKILDLENLANSFLTQGYSPEWAPDDKYIVYELGGNIYKINVATKTISQLTDWGNCFFPSWSPDGKKIAFDSYQFDPTNSSVIWIMNADGSEKKDISEHGVGEWREPNWSPDSSKILYSRFIGIGHPELFLMDTSGQNHTRLTFNNYEDWHTAWSKDGRKIAWNSGYKQNSGIWQMHSDGSNQHLIIKDGGFPSWSPKGDEIVYYGINQSLNIGTIWIFNLQNGTKRQLLIYP